MALQQSLRTFDCNNWGKSPPQRPQIVFSILSIDNLRFVRNFGILYRAFCQKILYYISEIISASAKNEHNETENLLATYKSFPLEKSTPNHYN